MAKLTNTYWNHKGRHQQLADELTKLIPVANGVTNPRKNKALEKFRKASNCYYDLYNNGLCNKASEFRAVFGVASSRYRVNNGFGVSYSDEMFRIVESVMDEVIVKAATEQGINVF